MLNPRTLSEFMSNNVDKDLYPAIFMMTPNGVLLAYSTPTHVPTLRHQAALVGDAWEKLVRSIRRPLPSRNVSSTRLKSPSSPHARPGPFPRITSNEPNGSSFSPNSTLASSSLQKGDVDIITLRIGEKNLLIKAIQPSLLLVMVGISASQDESSLAAAHEIIGAPKDSAPPLRPPSVQSVRAKPPHLTPPSQDDNNQADKLSIKSNQSRHESGTSVSESSTPATKHSDSGTDILNIQRRKLDRLVEYIKAEFDKDGFVMPQDLSK